MNFEGATTRFWPTDTNRTFAAFSWFLSDVFWLWPWKKSLDVHYTWSYQINSVHTAAVHAVQVFLSPQVLSETTRPYTAATISWLPPPHVHRVKVTSPSLETESVCRLASYDALNQKKRPPSKWRLSHWSCSPIAFPARWLSTHPARLVASPSPSWIHAPVLKAGCSNTDPWYGFWSTPQADLGRCCVRVFIGSLIPAEGPRQATLTLCPNHPRACYNVLWVKGLWGIVSRWEVAGGDFIWSAPERTVDLAKHRRSWRFCWKKWGERDGSKNHMNYYVSL